MDVIHLMIGMTLLHTAFKERQSEDSKMPHEKCILTGGRNHIIHNDSTISVGGMAYFWKAV